MTTTAVRAFRASPYRGSDVLNECLSVTPRCGDAEPRAEDAVRVGIMRRIAAARLKHCRLEALHDEVMLIVSELLTNALLHSGTTRITLSITVEEDGILRISVGDGMPGAAISQQVAADAESGRGLAMVEHVVKENGGNRGTSDDGATTWCRLNLPAGGTP